MSLQACNGAARATGFRGPGCHCHPKPTLAAPLSLSLGLGPYSGARFASGARGLASKIVPEAFDTEGEVSDYGRRERGGYNQRRGGGGRGRGRQNNYKPGDWECPECGQHNFASRTECFRCDAPVPENASQALPRNFRPGDWICPECNSHNFSNKTECFRCDADKPANYVDPEIPNSFRDNRESSGPSMRPGDWMCPDCNAHNFARNMSCFKCNVERPEDAGAPQAPRAGREGDWDCQECGFNNFASRTSCKR
mmetsp:Transcript_8982/g.25815  ORF Transcript_8982/g.25815 Transcript_8982/m.25815 type:complete len:253 (+) Transcript_8982:104-862(+)